MLNRRARRAIQSAPIVWITLGLRRPDNQPIREGTVAAAVIQDPAFRGKGNAASIAIGILLPIVRVLERVRTCLILREIAGWLRWCRDSAGRSGSWPFHHRQGQNLPLDGFKFGGVSPGVWLRATKHLDFLIHAFDAVLR